MMAMAQETKAERRERKRRNQRKMRMTGKANKILWQVIQKRASRGNEQS